MEEFVFLGSLVNKLKLYRSNGKCRFRLHSVFFLNGYNLKRQKIASFASIALPKIRQVKTVSSLQERISRIKILSIHQRMTKCLHSISILKGTQSADAHAHYFDALLIKQTKIKCQCPIFSRLYEVVIKLNSSMR